MFSDWKPYVVNKDNKILLIVRVGKCDPKKCNSACCKFIHLNGKEYYTNYAKGFGTRTNYGTKIRKRCKYLKRNNKCKLWGKRLPEACRQFPHPNDKMYWLTEKKCSFKFYVIGELNVKDSKEKK